MVTKAAISKTLNEVGIGFQRCWNVLKSFKEKQSKQGSVEEMLEFQYVLASALFQLDEIYRALSQERIKIIEKKHKLSPGWLKSRLRAIAKHQDTLKRVMSIGRTLGDSFAWPFYRNNRESLEKHFQHEKIPHTPPGIGGRGELEFIKRIKHINGHMVLFHGITTFLRLGDVSLIDLKTLTVTAIGDLKTKRIGDNQLRISLIFLGPNLPDKIPIDIKDPPETSNAERMPPRMEQNLIKQLRKMEDSFVPPTVDRKDRLQDITQINALVRVATALKQSRVTYERAGEGLLLIGFKNRTSKTFASKFLGKSRTDLNKLFQHIPSKVQEMVDKTQVGTSSNTNSLFFGHLSTDVIYGTTPVFWWPLLPIDFIQKVIFQDVIITTIYNPAHLIRKLRELGFEMEIVGRKGHLVISKVLGKGKLQFAEMGHIRNLVQNYLMSEDAVIALVKNILGKIKAGEFPLNSNILLTIQQIYDSDFDAI